MEIADRTLELRFEKPAGLTFEAGQYLDLTLLSPPETDAEGNTRSFSICSAPEDEDLAIATRLRDSAFKRCFETLQLGAGVQAEGPFGDFTLDENRSRSVILLAGGIGVTPFRSMLRQLAHRKDPRRILLFHSNRRPEEAPFLNELGDLSKRLPNFTYVPTMSQIQASRGPWEGEVGRILPNLILKHLQAPWAGSIFYLAGSPQMVAELRALLIDAGVEKDDLRIEEFAGY